MKFSDMSSITVPPGELTLWHVRGPHISDIRWITDKRRAALNQESSILDLVEARKSGQANPSWLACGFSMASDINTDAFAKTISAWTDRHENLRTHLISSGYPLQRVTLAEGNLKVEQETPPHISVRSQLINYLENRFDTEVGPLHWPGYLIATVSNTHSTTVFVAIDHTLTDGYSILEVPYEFHTLYTAFMTSSVMTSFKDILPSVISYPDFAEEERAAADMIHSDDEDILRWKKFILESGGELPKFPIPIDASVIPGRAQFEDYVELLDMKTASLFGKACRSAGGDIFSGLLTCMASVTYQITGASEFRTMIPLHTHKNQRQSSMGWYVGMAPVSFQIDGDADFEKTLSKAVCGLRGVKNLARIPIPKLSELLKQPLRDPFMVSFMDLRRVAGSANWTEWQTSTLRCRSFDPYEICFWFFLTRNGLFVNYRYPASEVAKAVLSDFVTRIKAMTLSIPDL